MIAAGITCKSSSYQLSRRNVMIIRTSLEIRFTNSNNVFVRNIINARLTRNHSDCSIMNLRPTQSWASGFRLRRFCFCFSSDWWRDKKHLRFKNDRMIRYFSSMKSIPRRSAGLKQVEASNHINIPEYHDGPPLRLGFGLLACQTHSSVVGTAGSTVVLTTVAVDRSASNNNNNEQRHSFLTVEYRQRSAGVGQIPQTRNRTDNKQMTTSEIIAARAVDRGLRPLLSKAFLPGDSLSSVHYHVHCSVQSCELWPNIEEDDSDSIINNDEKNNNVSTMYGHPVTTAFNSAAAAMADHLTEPVAATTLAIFSSGNIVQDPGPSLRHRIQDQKDPLLGELFYVGTRNEVVMLEWTTAPSSGSNGLPEAAWPHFLQVASASIQPTLDTIIELQSLRKAQKQQEDTTNQDGSVDGGCTRDAETERIRASLGLPPSAEVNNNDFHQEDSITSVPLISFDSELMQEVTKYCEERLRRPLSSLFGYDDNDEDTYQTKKNMKQPDAEALVAYLHHPESMNILLSKKERGMREQIMQDEISCLIDDYLETKRSTLDGNPVDTIRNEVATVDKVCSETQKRLILDSVVDYLFRKYMFLAAAQHGTRADRRGLPGEGCRTVRPVRLQVPALPSVVHGSALFARGETQVLCTVTLGPPADGLPRTDPYQPMTNPKLPPEQDPTKKLASAVATSYSLFPVGSLRFLRTQENLVSDLNTRKVKADKELTGDSGSFAEVQHAFLLYDFPPYSTGKVPPSGGGRMAADRRSIGHGKLAERAILPVLPDKHVFPYAIRMTSEVTDSNGSSSMASVCGATLALLDAGVPLRLPVAGVSVGLALENADFVNNKRANDEDGYALLLDITGTEDHFGYMDFKIAGTRDGVTAMQLDVKRPLPLNILTGAIVLAKKGRDVVLEAMESQASATLGYGLKPRPTTKESAPRVEVVRFDPIRKRDLLGPGGVVLRQLEDRYGVSFDLSQDGQCLMYGANRKMVEKAKRTVMELCTEVTEGETYVGTVIELKDFGAVVEILRNKEGLLHVSEIAAEDSLDHPQGTAGFVRQHLEVGQQVEVKCIGIDPVQGSVKLSLKALL